METITRHTLTLMIVKANQHWIFIARFAVDAIIYACPKVNADLWKGKGISGQDFVLGYASLMICVLCHCNINVNISFVDMNAILNPF